MIMVYPYIHCTYCALDIVNIIRSHNNSLRARSDENLSRYTLYLRPLKFRLPLIFATRVAKIKGSELQTMLGWRKLKAGEN